MYDDNFTHQFILVLCIITTPTTHTFLTLINCSYDKIKQL